MAVEIANTIEHHFPDLYNRLSQVYDPRKFPQYDIKEIIFGAISLFLFKCGSRNAYDNMLSHKKFTKNFKILFGFRLPDPDTVAGIIKQIPEQELELIKKQMLSVLIEKKVLDRWRYKGMFMIAIDGSGISSHKTRHCEQCLHKTYNKGKKTEKTVYYHNVLEAKLVTSNGFSISLGTVWIENPGHEYDKQDCEMKAFVRLAKQLKQDFPRTSICICADGLYPNDTFFNICKNNNWNYIVSLKEKSLKNLWKNIRLKNREFVANSFKEHAKVIEQKIQWINNEIFGCYTHQWIQIEEKQTDSKGNISKFKFVYLTNLEVSSNSVKNVCDNGRLRWKIEKQGFDQQKNHGYNICHKYCRKSYTGMKNYYQCCQIAHLINQLVELQKNFDKEYTPGKMTKKHLWFCLLAFMIMGHISKSQVQKEFAGKIQIQYKKE